MSSAKQIEANRRNAQKSKGPRTASGKARAARNSRKHALSTISRNNPIFAQRIAAIARAICHETTNAALYEQALIIGECTTVLACVQAQRIALIEQSLGGPCVHIADAQGAGKAELRAAESITPRDEPEAMGLAPRDLGRLERYERRALSRRKRAIETFMAISNTLQAPPSVERQALRVAQPSCKTIPGVDATSICNQVLIFGKTNPNSESDSLRQRVTTAPHERILCQTNVLALEAQTDSSCAAVLSP